MEPDLAESWEATRTASVHIPSAPGRQVPQRGADDGREFTPERRAPVYRAIPERAVCRRRVDRRHVDSRRRTTTPSCSRSVSPSATSRATSRRGPHMDAKEMVGDTDFLTEHAVARALIQEDVGPEGAVRVRQASRILRRGATLRRPGDHHRAERCGRDPRGLPDGQLVLLGRSRRRRGAAHDASAEPEKPST